MSPPRITPEFKDEAVRQITERGYAVAEVSSRLTHTQSGALTVNSRLTRFGARIDGRPLTALGLL